MKKTLLLIIICTLSFGVFGQYHRIAKQGRVWYTYVGGNLSSSTIVQGVAGDTVINGEAFSWLVSMDSAQTITGRMALIKEDTLNGRLDIFQMDTAGQITDTTIYDFSISVGDTVKAKPFFGGKEVFFVDSIFVITDFRNIHRKVIWLAGADPLTWCHNRIVAVWIEGIGSTQDLVGHVPYCQGIIELGLTLTCVFDGNLKIYGNGSKCYKVGLEEMVTPKMDIYPNPVKDRLFLQTELPIAKATIYSISGTLLLERNSVETTIDVSALKPGVFILEVIDVDGNVGRYKVVKD